MPIYIGNKLLDMKLPSPPYPVPDEGQENAVRWMIEGKDILLLSDPGAGKTLTALWALEKVCNRSNTQARTAVTCPLIAIRNWAIWSQVIFPSAVIQIVRGNSAHIRPDADILIFTFGTVSRKDAALVAKVKAWRPRVHIIDESDNLTGVDSNSTLNMLHVPDGLALHSEYVWPMTGTPIPRYLDGLWPVLSALFSNRLNQYGIGSKAEYYRTFCREKFVKYGGMRFPVKKVVGSQNLDLMTNILYDHPPIAVRNKLTIRSVPKFKEVTLDLKPSPALLVLQASALADVAMATDDFGNLFEVVSPDTAKALHVYGQELAPLVADSVIGLLPKIDGGILLLFWHRKVGEELARKLTSAGVKVALVDGSVPQNKVDGYVEAFNSGEIDVLIGQIKKMGVALNLQENCNTVCFAEDTYSDAMNLQAYQRVWRRGQEKDVNIIHFKSLMELADLRPNVAKRKGSDAAQVLDGEK